MKKLYLFMIVIMLVSPLLMAAGGNAIKISGYITAIDDDNMTIIVNDTLLVQVTGSTTIYGTTKPLRGTIATTSRRISSGGGTGTDDRPSYPQNSANSGY